MAIENPDKITACVIGLAEELGLPDLAYTDADFAEDQIVRNVMRAAITGLSDGDLVFGHPRYWGREAKLFGRRSFADGTVTMAIAEAATSGGRQSENMLFIQEQAVRSLALYTRNDKNQPRANPVRILPGSIRIDGGPHISLSGLTRNLLVVGACMENSSQTADMANFLDDGLNPPRSVFLTGSHFMNMILRRAYMGAALDKQPIMQGIDVDRYAGREDGVAAAVAEMVADPSERNTFDLILATNGRHVAAPDYAEAVRQSGRLLRTAGALVLRGEVDPADGDLGITKLTALALESGIDLRPVHSVRTVLDQIVNIRGKTRSAVVETVVFTKA